MHMAPLLDLETRILIVDDDPGIRELTAAFLTGHGYRVDVAADGAAMRAALDRAQVDLIVLDVMMPGEDGLSLCRYLSANTAVPVILLTALSEETDRVVGLEVGADDYITKPFSQRELLARIKNVLRRVVDAAAAGQPDGMDGVYAFEGWTFKVGERELRNPEGVLVPITTVDFYLLSTFLAHPKDVLDRDKLLGLAHGMQPDIFDRTIDLQISRLRRKIEPDPKTPTYIKTVRGKGYVWCTDVKRVP